MPKKESIHQEVSLGSLLVGCLFVAVVAAIAFLPASWIEGWMDADIATLKQLVGDEIVREANSMYLSMFRDSGTEDKVLAFFTATDQQPWSKVWATIGWNLVAGAYWLCRSLCWFKVWLPLFLPLLAVGLYSGYCEREDNRRNFSFASPYLLAKSIALAKLITVAVFITPLLPVTSTTWWVMPTTLCLLPWSIKIGLSKVQKEI